MPSIKDTLLAFAVVAAVASTGNDFHVNADLTKFDAKYDGTTMIILASVDQIEILVDAQKNSAFKAEFVTAKNKILNLATLGSLTPQSYACSMDTFYKSADVAYQDFSGYVGKNLAVVILTPEKYYKAAPTYWWDFYSEKMSTVAATVGNKDLTSLYKTFDAKMEADITNKASFDTITTKVVAFFKSADAHVSAYSAKVDSAGAEALNDIFAYVFKNAVCPGATVPAATPTTTTVMPAVTKNATPSPTTAKPTVTPTATPAVTASDSTTTPTPTEVNPISIEAATPAPTAPKAAATTTTPAVKSSGSKLASTVATAVLVAAVFAVGLLA